jgi:hypothetical protein
MVRAGTATSSRRRDEPNSFNILRIERLRITVEHMAWRDTATSFLTVVAWPSKKRRAVGCRLASAMTLVMRYDVL